MAAAGVLDGWHEIQGFPEGFRPQRPEDADALQYSRTGVAVERWPDVSFLFGFRFR